MIRMKIEVIYWMKMELYRVHDKDDTEIFVKTKLCWIEMELLKMLCILD
jgi:hypothetical protein